MTNFEARRNHEENCDGEDDHTKFARLFVELGGVEVGAMKKCVLWCSFSTEFDMFLICWCLLFVCIHLVFVYVCFRL